MNHGTGLSEENHNDAFCSRHGISSNPMHFRACYYRQLLYLPPIEQKNKTERREVAVMDVLADDGMWMRK